MLFNFIGGYLASQVNSTNVESKRYSDYLNPMPGISNDTAFPKKVKPTAFTIIVVELSKGIDTKAKYDGQRAVPVKFEFKGSSNMVCGDDSAKKGTQLTLIEESYINKE